MASKIYADFTFSSNYERMTGNCTRHIATKMVSTAFPAITLDSYILDNACGPGIVTEEIKRAHPSARILGTDISPDMIDQFKQRIEKNGWVNVETDILDHHSLTGLVDNSFTHVLTNLGFPAPRETELATPIIKEMFRVLKHDGVAIMSTWADRVWVVAFIKTALAIRPQEEPQHPFIPSPETLKGSWLLRSLEEGGFGNNVEVRPCETYVSASSLDELVDNMWLAKGMFFQGYNDEELEKAKPFLKEELTKVRTFKKVDGGVMIGMKAWIAVGWKKGDEKEIAL